MTAPALKAPFPWFGGKSRVAHLVWNAFGPDVANYVEPFAGSLAVLLARPAGARIETVNDLDCYLSNFWRAVREAPEEVADHADFPVSEVDMQARHRWLVERAGFRELMRENPAYFDAKIAGWWVYGLCQWIGGGWCAESNWATPEGGDRTATQKKRPSLGKGARGVQRATVNWNVPPQLSNRGVHATGLYRKLVGLANGSGSGTGVHSRRPLYDWMLALAERLRRVRICCGDWSRVLGPSATVHIGVTGVLLDPPYDADLRAESLYGIEGAKVSRDVRKWAIANGDNPKMRIALCGYEGEHKMPKSWQCVAWKTPGGYAAAAGNHENSAKERIWFSPHCERAEDQAELFAIGGAA